MTCLQDTSIFDGIFFSLQFDLDAGAGKHDQSGLVRYAGYYFKGFFLIREPVQCPFYPKRRIIRRTDMVVNLSLVEMIMPILIDPIAFPIHVYLV